MSRSNPYKKKRRQTKSTVLIYGEGLTEEIFLKHLKQVYSKAGNIAVTIRKGRGGSVDNTVVNASRYLGDFDRRFVVIDDDRPRQEIMKAEKKAARQNITIFKNTPCIEATMLSILNNGKRYSQKSTSWCKKEFKLSHVSQNKRGGLEERLECKKIFPKKLLDEQRKRNKILNGLILTMTKIKNANSVFPVSIKT